MEYKKPLLGISAGDPAGIGPEITVKALSHKEIFDVCKPLVVCDAGIIKQILKICALQFDVHLVEKPADGLYKFGTIDVLDMKNVDLNNFRFNEVSAMAGKAS